MGEQNLTPWEYVPKIRELVLSKFRIDLHQFVSKQFLEDTQFDAEYDFLRQGFHIGMKSYIWGRKIHSTPVDTISYPTTWWDAFKER